MTESAWTLPERGAGRLYQQHPDLIIRYEDVDVLIDRIVEDLQTFLTLENSVRLLLDGETAQPAAGTVSVPFEGEAEVIYRNLATLIYQQLWGYYLSADPKATHHGLTNLVFEGNQTSLIRRETEKFLNMLNTRNDIAGRLMQEFHMAADVKEFERDVYMKDVCSQYLDIELGVRMYTHGEAVNRVTTFVPVAGGENAIDRIYYNIEHMIHLNLISYDEIHDHYLPVSAELITREIEDLIRRSKTKENTRKKIINGLKFQTVLAEDNADLKHISMADLYYDKLNRIDLLEEAAQRSRDLLSTALIRSAEMTADAGVKLDKVKMEERVYIERPKAQARQTVAAHPRPQRAKAQPKAQPATEHSDGLEEL